MAIEIRELVIKAVIVDDQNRSGSSASEPASAIQQEQIIQECVNQVLKIIKKSKNR
jgi:hypothetical protein